MKTVRSFFRSFTGSLREKVSCLLGGSSSGRKRCCSKEPADYRKACLSSAQKVRYYAVCCAAFFSAGLLFYRSFAVGAAFCIAAVPLEKIYASYVAEKRRERLLTGFKDALYSISGAVAAGRQMPFAIEFAATSAAEASGTDSDIFMELQSISDSYRRTHSDIGIQLEDFGRRSGLAEVKQFASSYRTCQVCGGDLEEVCRKNAELLLSRMSFNTEIRSMISQKKLDIVLLAGMPVAVLLLLNLTNYSYVAVLYETPAGRVVMTLCLFLIVSALLWGIKITKIEM